MEADRWFEDGRLELFNLANDPYENNDVSAKQTARVKALHAKLKAWRAETGVHGKGGNMKTLTLMLMLIKAQRILQ
ncbi:MAG: hypothetical protein L0387_20250 [Acidobacteria bacterium]|nr:hypothetical protein [Acidobacteriota bacterium]MCI0623955.1 hypothetical protein [Acidobacteriota bacterium]MCI0722583.1 hypothetical protein [Acidobacteriota bacterium]